jgi:hypothetical protein
MKPYHKFIAAFMAVCFLTVAAWAADASPAGTWKFTQQGRGGNAMERTLTLKYDEGKLSGVLAGMQGGQFQIPDTAIADAVYKDGAISFTVTTDFNGTKRTTKYEGKLEGDAIKGTIERPARGEGAAPTKNEWLATRAKS